MLLLLFVTPIHAQNETPFDSMDLVVAQAAAPFLERGNDPCEMIAEAELYPIKFESGTYALISSREPLANADLELSAQTTAVQSIPVGTISSTRLVSIPAGRKLELKADNPCGQSVTVAEVDSESTNSAASVSAESFRAIVKWQKEANDTGQNFHDFLQELPDVSYAEKLYLIQQVTFRGKPYPESLRANLISGSINARVVPYTPVGPPPPPKPPKTGGGGGVSTCDCLTIQLRINNLVSPINGVSDSYAGGKNISGIYSSDDDTAANNRIKVWSAFALEGPSRYLQLWADTEKNRCIADPYRFGLNDVSSNLEPENEQIFPEFNARLEYNMLCINGEDLPTATVDEDGLPVEDPCGCTQEIKYQAAYHSVVRAQAEYNSNYNPFCANDHSAMASAEDYVILAVGDTDLEGEFEIVAGNVNSQILQCEMEYVGPTAADFILLGLYAYTYIKGGSFNSGTPIIDESVNLAYNQNYANQATNYIQTIFGSDWREFTEECGGDLVGKAAGITPELNRVEGTVTLRPNKPYTILLASGSRLRVGGQRRWHANARVLSSFSLAGIVRGQSNSNNDEGFNSQCCTAPTATYSMAMISEDAGLTAVTTESWWDEVQGFLNLWGITHEVIGGVGEVIGTPPEDCGTEITIVKPKSMGGGKLEDQNFSLLSFNQQTMVSVPRREGTTETLRLINTNGQILYNSVLPQGAKTNIQLHSMPPGIYFLSLLRSDGTSYAAKIAHTL